MDKSIVEAGRPEYRTIHFDWLFVDWCNYQCSYCCAANFMAEKFSKKTSPAKYKLILTRLKQVQTPFVLELLGGEPTLHPYIIDVLLELGEMEYCERVELVTNLSRSLKFFKELDRPELTKLEITPSYHPEYFTQEFIDKNIVLSQFKYPTHMVSINLSDKKENWPQILNMLETFETHGVRYGFNYLFAANGYVPEYTAKCFEMFAPYINKSERKIFPYKFDDGTTEMLSEVDVVARGLDQFTGYKCTSQIYRITPDGTITNMCTRRKLPVMLTNDVLFKEERCPEPKCICDIMYHFVKRKDETIR